MGYKYYLDRSSKKFYCPRCDEKRFVRLVCAKTGEYMNELYGRCDRQNSCGYNSYPDATNEVKPNMNNDYKQPEPPTFHPVELISEYGRNFKQNNFVQYLRTLFPDDVVRSLIRDYLLGTSDHVKGGVIFWRFDGDRLRGGKIIQYDRSTGSSKLKDGNRIVTWMHTILKIKKIISKFNLSHCLVGVHLLLEKTNVPICIVESEKTAIIMSGYMPEYLWLATGGEQMLSYSLIKCLHGRKIFLIPDYDAVENWKKIADRFVDLKFDIECLNIYEHLDKSTLQPNDDIADIFIKKANDQQKVALSQSEEELLYFTKINSNILNLVEEFELTDKNGSEFRIHLLKKAIGI